MLNPRFRSFLVTFFTCSAHGYTLENVESDPHFKWLGDVSQEIGNSRAVVPQHFMPSTAEGSTAI
ncbi:hypothetical protein SAMN02745220_03891 [Desulfopila aestuarii DSM 18488]|uniref:Uncharacterized protein n=1 Tax=Desulfopila aestuarii DSM 18488 TaxID=1121416 RepID=A0A1M7YF20_9BACT|nr:hypothetical protein SAMN02745220_03891 [Desulfopila aestuarii DSM 18488]